MNIRQFICGLFRRHEWGTHWRGTRVYQSCNHCNRERPGWVIIPDPRLQKQRDQQKEDKRNRG